MIRVSPKCGLPAHLDGVVLAEQHVEQFPVLGHVEEVRLEHLGGLADTAVPHRLHVLDREQQLLPPDGGTKFSVLRVSSGEGRATPCLGT